MGTEKNETQKEERATIMKEMMVKLESLEDLLQQVIVSIDEQSKKELKLPEISVPDYREQLDKINLALHLLKPGHVAEAIQKRLEALTSAIQQLSQQQAGQVQPQVRQYRFTFFPEQVRQPEYFKIMVLGFLGLVFLVLAYLLLSKVIR